MRCASHSAMTSEKTLLKAVMNLADSTLTHQQVIFSAEASAFLKVRHNGAEGVGYAVSCLKLTRLDQSQWSINYGE